MKISTFAIEAAQGMCQYCETRFPTDTPPHGLLDVPWFAEKVQIAIDKVAQPLHQEIASLGMLFNQEKCLNRDMLDAVEGMKEGAAQRISALEEACRALIERIEAYNHNGSLASFIREANDKAIAKAKAAIL